MRLACFEGGLNMAFAKSKKPALSAGHKKSGGAKAASHAGRKQPRPLGGKSSASKPGRKGGKNAFSTVKSKQLAVGRLKRAIWMAAQDINSALINAAAAGHLATAKELFNFAGVYAVPGEQESNAPFEPAPAAAAPVAAAAAAGAATINGMPIERINRFFDNLDIPPSTAEPEEAAATVE